MRESIYIRACILYCIRILRLGLGGIIYINGLILVQCVNCQVKMALNGTVESGNVMFCPVYASMVLHYSNMIINMVLLH